MLKGTSAIVKPLEKIRKIKGRSFKEIKTRGEQALNARAEQIGLSNKLPTDAELFELIEKKAFGLDTITAEDLFDKFYEDAVFNFFPAFRQKQEIIAAYSNEYSDSAKIFIEKADKILDGKFDLLGYENLDFGVKPNWHFEPIAGKRIPLKHWKQFDDLSSDETGDKKIVWELNRHQHFFTLGVAFWLTNDERYAECFASHLDSWMKENPPGMGVNWASSLEISFRVVSWIWAFHFFKDSAYFTPELFKQALKFVHKHARHLTKYLSTYYSPNTHLTGEALGLYYIGTQFPFFKQAREWRDAGEKILFEELDRQIFADGVYFEQSTWYQRYTTDFYTHFLILKTLSGEEIDRDLQTKLGAKLQSLNDFLMYATRPDGTTPIIGDDDGGRCLPLGNAKSDDFRHVLSTNAILFERGDYKLVAGKYAEETLWLLGAAGRQSFEFLHERKPSEASAAFETGGYFIMRDGWTATDNFMLVDCGEIGALSGGHGHSDALAVDVAVGGVTTLVDAGTYTYHESEALRDEFRTTEAHNTLTIDGKSQSTPRGKFSWQTKAKATLENWISEPRFDFFEGSHDGYEQNLSATHTRGILFLKNDYWIMRDFVKTSGKHDYRLNFHFASERDAQIETSENGAAFAGENNSRIFAFGDNGHWEQSNGAISNHYGKRENAAFLQLASAGIGSQEFFTFLLPTDAGAEQPQVVETQINGGRAFVINCHGYQDLFIFGDGEQVVRTEIFNTDFRFLWARLSKGETLPEEFVLIGGTKFSLGGREIINHPHELKSATARRFGNKLNVKTSETIFSVSLPKKNSRTYILKQPVIE